jgi:RimJ/RimL family protein N-acetyltransferase
MRCHEVSTFPEPSWPITDGLVELRRFTLSDVSDVTRACQDPEIARWTTTIPWPYEDHHARDWIARHDAAWSGGTFAPFAFCDVTTGTLQGSITLSGIEPERRSAMVGYWAAPWARNRGATTRALRLVCDWGFEHLDLHRMELVTKQGNVASERVAAKAGFERSGKIDRYKPPRALDPDARYEVTRWVRRSPSPLFESLT